MHCPGSVALYDQLTERRTTEYALTGTLAHLVCELALVQGESPSKYLGEHLALGDGVNSGTVTEAIVEAAKVYVDHVRFQHHKFGGKLIVEQSFDLSWLYPGMFGRNDAAILPDDLFGTLRIFDYKNGRKHVSAANNPQLMYYALGALGKDNPLMVERVICTIVQPNAMGKDAIEEWETTPEELYAVTDPMFESGCDCAILGCTELSLIGKSIDDERFVDSLMVLANCSIKLMGRRTVGFPASFN